VDRPDDRRGRRRQGGLDGSHGTDLRVGRTVPSDLREPVDSFDEVVDDPFPLRGHVSTENKLRDQIAFMERVCGEWHRVYADTIRKYDENHLT
jgi:hypothetical protein